MIRVLRTDATHTDFIELVKRLDADLAERDGADHSFYAQFNTIGGIQYAVVAYEEEQPVGCGAMKAFGPAAMEIKRMYTLPASRGKGIANRILEALEHWAAELSCEKCVLETGKRQPEAIRLYQRNGYRPIPNYGQYVGVENSMCFEKRLINNANRIEETINGKSVIIKKPNRVAHTYEQTIHGSIKQIFPLYCPVKELLWTESWNPEVVYSNSGVVEKNAIFTSKDGGRTATWYVTTYDMENGQVEMIKLVPGYAVSKLEIKVEPIQEKISRVLITYTITALSEEGDPIFEGFTKENYDISMQAWEKAMNHYLKTGELLKGLPEF